MNADVKKDEIVDYRDLEILIDVFTEKRPVQILNWRKQILWWKIILLVKVLLVSPRRQGDHLGAHGRDSGAVLEGILLSRYDLNFKEKISISWKDYNILYIRQKFKQIFLYTYILHVYTPQNM